MDGWGIKDLHKYGEEMSKNSYIPSQEQQENKWAEWLGRGEREGDKGPKAFCPGWRHQPGQKGGLLSQLVVPTGTKKGTRAFCPGWIHQPGQKALAPLSPSLSPRPSHSAHLFSCCSWLGIEEFLLISSPHLCRSLIPRPSIGAKGLGLVFLFFLACIAHFML